MYVYADIFLALNIVLNAVILILTAWTAGMTVKAWRIFAAALAGGAYALGEVAGLPEILYGPVAKFLVSMAIVGTAFSIRSFRSMAIAVACFYVVSLLFGGAVVGWLFFLQPASQWGSGATTWASVSWLHLATGAAIAFVLAVIGFRRLAVSTLHRQTLYKMAIGYHERKVELVARLDTGNDLYTLPERKPVILVTSQALAPLLGEEVNSYLNNTDPAVWLANLDQCRDVAWLSRIQVIPYRGVGSSSLLLGFRPDKTKVLTKAGWTEAGVVIIGILGARMASDDSYQALLHPAVLQGINANEGASICA